MKFKKALVEILFFITAFSSLAIAEDKVELKFFADEMDLKIEDRKNLVAFVNLHKPGDLYEFEVHSLSDPLNVGVDMGRLTFVQGVFRENGVEIDKLIEAKVRFISGESQKIIVIRKKSDAN